MNKRTILSLLKVLLVLLCVSATYAQAPANTVLIGAEGSTIASSTGTNVAYFWGSGSTYVAVPQPVTYPLVLSCLNGDPVHCPPLGGDPTPGTSKTLYAVEQATAYTVTLSSGAVVPVPALPSAAPAACLPTPPNSPVPATPKNCLPIANGVAVGTDGGLLVAANGQQQTSPIFLQYCQGNVCNPPFPWQRQPLIIGPNATMGGPTGGTGTGTLYIFPSLAPTAIITASVNGAIQSSTIPAQ